MQLLERGWINPFRLVAVLQLLLFHVKGLLEEQLGMSRIHPIVGRDRQSALNGLIIN